MEKIKNNNPKIEVKERRKNKAKRKISIFTTMLWVFLISTMIAITVNSTKKTNALEVREISDDNWNISLVMYDRGSSTPNEKITECTYNSKGGQLCMQINYACTTGKEYQPGEIEITIPGISKDNFSEYWRGGNTYSNWLRDDITIAADKLSDTTKKYDFSYSYNEKTNIYTFINNSIVETNEHFEGTIQIVYNLNPRFRIKTDLEFRAKMKENIENAEGIIAKESNVCNFHYTSTKKEYGLIKEVFVAPREDYTKIEDILDDYYWVKCYFSCTENMSSNGIILALDDYGYSLLTTSGHGELRCIKENLPDGCLMYDKNFDKIEKNDSENTYSLSISKSNVPIIYYIGYPKSTYNEGDNITNISELWGRYEDEENRQKLAEVSKTVKLVNFNFEYDGELYRINKSAEYDKFYLSSIKEKGSSSSYILYPKAFYSGSLMDIEVGDDLLYITRENGDVTKLRDDEYNFTKIDIPVFYTYNKYSGSTGDKLVGYSYEVKVRYKNTNEYVTYSEGVTKDSSEELIFNREDIVGIKLVIKDLDKTLYNGSIKVYTNIYPSDCSLGKLYNFDYIQAYIKDSDGNRTLHNEVNLDNYTTEMTKLKIAENDIETYGMYMQRGVDSSSIVDGKFELRTNKSNNIKNNNVKEEKYEIMYNLRSYLDLRHFKVDKGCTIKQYDILPSGINLASSKDEIINSIETDLSYENLLLKDGTKFKSQYEIDSYIKKNTHVDIDYNYKNSGRTKISIIYNLNDIDWSYYLTSGFISKYINTKLKVEIPYDSISEYGTTYTNYTYAMWGNQEYSYEFGISDKGFYDKLASDIDEDGDTTESLTYNTAELNITHAVSSKQAVIKQVRTDMTNGKFVSDMAEAQAGSEYTYRLKVTTGANSLKDLIIYDTLETILDSDGNDISSGWNGKFLGVDTSYAMSKGYAPKVYYSVEKNPGKLTEVPEKWMELTDEVDKTTVKSICLDLRYRADGSEMELASNDLVYVLVNMKAPEDRTLTTSANNMFSTNWRAKDPMGTVIDNVEGIYSNQVKVSIFKEENRKKDIVGSKIWENITYFSKIPSSITVKLFQDEVEYMRCEVTKEDDWKYVFKDVPVYKNSNLEKYEYRVEEEKVPCYDTTYDGYNIINTLSGKNIKGKKTWNDEWNIYSTRPENITVKLMQDGIEYRRCEVTGDNNWEYEFLDVPIYKNDSKEEYEYSIEEIEVPGYEYKVEYDKIKDNYNITNTLNVKNLEVVKIWDDNENKHGLRPKFVKILLYDGENKVREEYINEENGWKCEFTSLPEFRADGSKIEYRIDEEVEEYREEYLGGGAWDYFENFENEGDFELYNKYYIKEIAGNVVTNKYVDPDERIKVIGKKVWEDEDNKALKRPVSVVLQIKNGDKVVSEGVVTKDNNWSFEFEVPKYDEEGHEIEYYIDEKETPKFYEKEIVDDFTVKNKFKVPDDKVKIEVIKLWEDFEDKYKKRPNKVTLQVLSEDKIVAEQVVDEKSNWRHEFELAKYDENGNEIEYRVDEKENIENYEKRISGYTVINKCIYEPVTDTSDINILLYIIIFGLSVMGIIAIGCIVRKKKINNR